MISRRRFIVAAGGAMASIGGLAYARKAEPRWLNLSQTHLSLPPGVWSGSPLRVLHLSDLHLSRTVSLEFIDAAITRSLTTRPDLICITGDFVTVNDTFDEAVYTPVLARLAAAAPTFATLGNHDGGVFPRRFGGAPSTNRVGKMIARAGIEWLHNQHTFIRVRGRSLHLAGVGDWWNHDCRPELAFRDFYPPADEPVITLSHNPDSKAALKKYPWHVLLCGHTHGGQCGLPLVGRALAPVKDKAFIAGAYRFADRWLYITRGIGNLHGMRFLCRPEASLLTLA